MIASSVAPRWPVAGGIGCAVGAFGIATRFRWEPLPGHPSFGACSTVLQTVQAVPPLLTPAVADSNRWLQVLECSGAAPLAGLRDQPHAGWSSQTR